MEENPPRYPHTKYEKFLISGCRVISNQKSSKYNLVIERDNGRTYGRMYRRTNKWTNGTDENYIPLRQTSYARGIKSYLLIYMLNYDALRAEGTCSLNILPNP